MSHDFNPAGKARACRDSSRTPRREESDHCKALVQSASFTATGVDVRRESLRPAGADDRDGEMENRSVAEIDGAQRSQMEGDGGLFF